MKNELHITQAPPSLLILAKTPLQTANVTEKASVLTMLLGLMTTASDTVDSAIVRQSIVFDPKTKPNLEKL